jgi:hypothetical protein
VRAALGDHFSKLPDSPTFSARPVYGFELSGHWPSDVWLRYVFPPRRPQAHQPRSRHEREYGRRTGEDPSCIDYCTVWFKVYREYTDLCFELPGHKHYNDPRCTGLEDKLFHLDGRRLTTCGCEGMTYVPPSPARPASKQ